MCVCVHLYSEFTGCSVIDYMLEGWVDGSKYIMNNVTLDYQRSYQCNANTSFRMNCSNMTAGGNMSSCNGSLYVSFVNFQVQAFSFYNDPNAITFGNSKNMYMHYNLSSPSLSLLLS